MSLERNLIISVFVVLLVSLAAGALLTYEQAASRVHTEMNAALAVGRRVVQNAIDDSADQPDPGRRLAGIVGAFNGERHLRAFVTDPHGAVIMQSSLALAADPAPRLFLNLVSGPKLTARAALPASLQAEGTLTLTTDAHNEASEAWADVKLDLLVLGIFFCLVLAFVVRIFRRAMRPLQQLCAGLTRISVGDYAIRLETAGTKEFAAVQTGFNAMAERLADMELQNRVLQTRVQRIQEEERAELARDLHDEVAPFLFAVSADASLIRQHVGGNKADAIDARAASILSSVGHMQLHLRHVLSRLMPDVLLDLGLAGAIESLVHFWKSRRPDIEFALRVDAVPMDDRRTAVAFRVVQESLSNAVRHASPTRVDVSVVQNGEDCVVEVADDGAGLPHGPVKGLGLLGMRERVSAIGGRLTIGARAGSNGLAVRAILAPTDTVVMAPHAMAAS